MANQYFEDNRSLPSNRKEHSFRFYGHCYTFTADNGVFSKDHVDPGTELLLKTAAEQPVSGPVLDLGCGTGVIGIVLKTMYPEAEVTCSDVNPRALELTALNADRNRCELEVVLSDGFEKLPGFYQAIVTNPPIRVGKKVLYRLLEECHAHLKPEGLLLAVIRRDQGAESAMKKLRELFGSCEVAAKGKGYWILRCIR